MRKPNNPGIPFPLLPTRWGEEERRFAFGLRDLFEQLRWQRAYPVGMVVLYTREDEESNPVKPFAFGEWERITTGISGVYGWKRVR